MPIGVYDRIVCAACEVIFGPYDTYASRILIQDIKTYERIRLGKKLLALVAHSIDYSRLKLFAISVIWRASVCSHAFYDRIDLGPFEKRAKDMIVAGDPGDACDFATWWSIFDMQWTPGLMDPFFERWNGVNSYRFYLGRILAYIKADSRAVPAAFQEITLAPGRPLVLVGRNFDGSADAKAMIHLIRTSKGGVSGAMT